MSKRILRLHPAKGKAPKATAPPPPDRTAAAQGAPWIPLFDSDELEAGNLPRLVAQAAKGSRLLVVFTKGLEGANEANAGIDDRDSALLDELTGWLDMVMSHVQELSPQPGPRRGPPPAA